MAFFGNDAVNRVNLHTGVQAFAYGAGTLFLLVYLLTAGLSAPQVLLALAAILAGRFVLRPLVLPVAIRFGLKPILIAGALGIALQYPILAEVRGTDGALIALCVVAALGEVFYYLAYNAYFAAVGDAEHRGHQIGAREAIFAVVGVVAPLLGAWGLVAAGPRWTFAAVGLVQALSVLPLLGAPNVAVKREAPGALRAARPGMVLIALDGWFDASFIFVWQMALFLSLGESVSAYGGAMALAGLAGAVCGVVFGRRIDRGRGRHAVLVAASFTAAVIALRVGSLDSPLLAAIANAAGAVALTLIVPPLGAVVYNLAKASPCPLRFTLATEGGWDLGAMTCCLAAAALLHAGAPWQATLILALPALAATAWLLARRFGREGKGG